MPLRRVLAPRSVIALAGVAPVWRSPSVMSRQRATATRSTPQARQTLLLGVGAALVVSAAWVILTAAADGTTYHLFPLLIGAAAPVATRYVVPIPSQPSRSPRRSAR